ncbi:hypothetical protein [Tritonibacter multivorans]|uniref:hypothetical protein n=1 Tax=Tritonibacter multivorans TaxID=928856 RepID=UPI001040F5D4|nr:hypothetical protein [Tritonibacter multivorans]MDA7421970.1 hypothetical protein [Tritonibacter multivorans]
MYEPMNGDSGDRQISRYFERPGVQPLDDAAFDGFVDRLGHLSLNLRSGVFKHETGLRRIAKIVLGGRSRHSLLRARLTPFLETLIWKDPLAALAARAAVERHGIPVVVTYRPPEAVVASYKRLSWRFPVHQMAEDLSGAGLKGGALPVRDAKNIVEESAALWSMIYAELLSLAQARPDLVTVLHMDAVLRQPRQSYQSLFARLGLEHGARAERGLASLEERLAQKSKSDLPSGHPHSQDRNLNVVNSYWRALLSEEEVARIRARTEDVRMGYDRYFESGGAAAISMATAEKLAEPA